jgi:two-component system LytT family response regulator
MMKALIVDDEKLLRDSLIAQLRQYCPEVEVVSEAESVESGLAALNEFDVDLVFLDIKMSDGSGFDILSKVAKQVKGVQNIDFKTIFTTAYDEFALKAFKFSAIDYLLKPIDPDELKIAVRKVNDSILMDNNNKYDILLENINRLNQGRERIALATAERIHIYNVMDIVRCESLDNYTYFFLSDGSKLLISKTLKEYEDLLNEFGFVRVHRSHLINLNRLTSYEKAHGATLTMEDGTKIPVAQRKREFILSILKSYIK